MTFLRSLPADETNPVARARDALHDGLAGVEWPMTLTLSMNLPAKLKKFDREITAIAPGTEPVNALAVRCFITDADRAIADLETVFEWTGRRSVQVLNLSLPPVHPACSSCFSGYQDALNFAWQMGRTLRFAAERSGTDLALEAAAGGCLLSPVELRELLDACGSHALGVCLDVERLKGIGLVTDWLSTLGSRVRCIRLDAENATQIESLIESRYRGVIALRGDRVPANLTKTESQAHD